MSGITPILDTLLHHVLGKRVDTLSPERQPAPVKPLVPTEAIQAVRSDSRLDPRATTSRYADMANVSGGSAVSSPPPSDSADVRTQFSSVARFLSELLNEQTKSPVVIRSPIPLMPRADLGAEKLANNLQRSVEYSGLFYESHLFRSYQGKWDWAKLRSEPQMDGRAVSSATFSDPYKEESARGLLRQQLDLLSVPQLRWEGEVWPGLHLEICLQYHQVVDDLFDTFPDGEDADSSDLENDDFWQTDLTLALPRLGELVIRLAIQGDNLKVIATPASETAEDVLLSGVGLLREQLEALGFREIQVMIGPCHDR